MNNQKGSARARRVSLVDMSSAFFVLGLGISFAILVILLELIIKRMKNLYFTNNDLQKNEEHFLTKEEIEITIKYFW